MGYLGFKPAEQAVQIGADTILSSHIDDGVIVNADINASASIAVSKTALSAGAGLTLSTNSLSVDADQSGQITSVGTLSSLTLGGDLLVPQYIKHVGNTDCHIEFGTDEIKLRTGDSSKLIARNANIETYVPVLGSDGSVSAPAFAFSSDTSTGMYREGAGSIGFTRSGEKTVAITANQLGVFGGEGDHVKFIMYADEGDDDNDKYRIEAQHTGGGMEFQTATTGSWASMLTLSPAGSATFTGKINAPGQWELIAIDKLSSDGMVIQNDTCFSSDNYVMFKLVIGWIGFNGSDHLYFRWIENGSETSASDYFGGTDIATHASTTREHKAFAGTDNVDIFEDPWDDLAGGVHGEIQIYNASAPTVDGLNTDRGQQYRPWLHANLFGYDAVGDAGYGMQETWARFNSNMNPENIDGYKIYTVNNNLRAKSHIFVYGLRTA